MVGVVYALLMPEFSFGNYFLFFITISSFLITFSVIGPIVDASLLKRLASISLAVLTVEAAIGVVQAVVAYSRSGTFGGSTGDAVCGTIALVPVPATGGNVMFAILVSSLFLFVLAASEKKATRPRLAAYAIVLLAWLLASAVHTLVFFGMAVVLAGLLGVKRANSAGPRSRPRGRGRAGCLAATGTVILVAGLAFLFIPGNISRLPTVARETLDIREGGASPKAVATYLTLSELPRDVPLQPLIGIGPGQYSSRASLIRSGEYLRRGQMELFPEYLGSYADRYILLLYRPMIQAGRARGSSYVPFYSWLSLYGEMGFVGVVLVLWLIYRAGTSFREGRTAMFARMPLLMLVLLLYVCLLGFHKNYWEWSQAVFPAFLILKLGHVYLQKEQRPGTEDRASVGKTGSPVST